MSRPEVTGRKIGASHDELVPDAQIRRELNISEVTLWRWDRDPQLDFPPPIRIRNRKFRSRHAFEAFKERMVSRAIANRQAA
jgi:hypothetical protein